MSGLRSVLLGLIVARLFIPQVAGDQTMPRPELRVATPRPRGYVVARRATPVVVDGSLADAAWSRAGWSDDFTDIEGDIRPAPRLRTRVKMLYDSVYWYIGAELVEPDLWATIRERDAVIFQDNDFEVFVDPDGDTHRYFELELNALGTAWDLFLPKPYRDGGRADNDWNIDGLRLAVALDGTPNDSRDRDRGWTVELAIPWTAFADSGRTHVPPREGEIWRVNFSRVEWDLDRAGRGYRKRVGASGTPLPEHNWVWSPQGAVNMHLPEMWGLVRFGGRGPLIPSTGDDPRWTLRRVYYAQREYRTAHGAYLDNMESLGGLRLPAALIMVARPGGWEATLPARGGVWHIREDGRVWRD